MSYHDVYIGNASGNFLWEGGDWNGNFPATVADLPKGGQNSEFSAILKLVDSGKFEGKQTDWGTWVVKVTKNDLAQLVKKWYRAKDRADDLRRAQAIVARLSDGTEYLLQET